MIQDLHWFHNYHCEIEWAWVDHAIDPIIFKGLPWDRKVLAKGTTTTMNAFDAFECFHYAIAIHIHMFV